MTNTKQMTEMNVFQGKHEKSWSLYENIFFFLEKQF